MGGGGGGLVLVNGPIILFASSSDLMYRSMIFGCSFAEPMFPFAAFIWLERSNPNRKPEVSPDSM